MAFQKLQLLGCQLQLQGLQLEVLHEFYLGRLSSCRTCNSSDWRSGGLVLPSVGGGCGWGEGVHPNGPHCYGCQQQLPAAESVYHAFT